PVNRLPPKRPTASVPLRCSFAWRMMTPRTQFLKNGVSVTTPASSTSVRRAPAVQSRIRVSRLMGDLGSEGLADAEVHAPPSRLGFAVHEQSRDRVELVADVEAKRTDGRLVAEAGADGAAQIVQFDLPAVRPDVAGVEEQDRAEAAADPLAAFEAVLEHAVAADRQARFAQRAELVAPPPANARRPAEEKLSRERHRGGVVRGRADIAELRAVGEREPAADGEVVAAVERDLREAERARQQVAGFFKGERRLVALARVQQVVGRRVVPFDLERVEHAALI